MPTQMSQSPAIWTPDKVLGVVGKFHPMVVQPHNQNMEQRPMGPTAKNHHEASMQSNRKQPCNQIESIDTIYVTVQRKFCRNSILRPPGPQYSSCLSSPWSFLTSISTSASCLQDANPKVGVEVTLRVQALKHTWQWGLTNKIYIMSISYIKIFHSTTLLQKSLWKTKIWKIPACTCDPETEFESPSCAESTLKALAVGQRGSWCQKCLVN